MRNNITKLTNSIINILIFVVGLSIGILNVRGICIIVRSFRHTLNSTYPLLDGLNAALTVVVFSMVAGLITDSLITWWKEKHQ